MMTVIAAEEVTDYPPFKHLGCQDKLLSDDGKTAYDNRGYIGVKRRTR
jgi:hypothetical protein